jgi:hypothetical protein
VSAVDAYFFVSGARNWLMWLNGAVVALGAGLGILPLAVRLLWAYKIRQLGIHELEVSDAGLALHGVGLRVESPIGLYSGLIKSRRYLLLTRSNGLFSFIPKSGLSPERIEAILSILTAHVGRRPSTAETPGAIGV